MPASGPLSPGTVVDDAGVGTVTWSNPGNAAASDDARSEATLTSVDPLSHYLKATNFGFAIPTDATVTGIEVAVERSASNLTDVRDNRVRIVKANVIGATDRADTATTDWPTADAYKTYGSSSDLWGETWTPAQINAADFGIAFAAQAINGTQTARVDHIRITVYYTEPVVPGAMTATLPFNVTLTGTLTSSEVLHGPVGGSWSMELTTLTGAGIGEITTASEREFAFLLNRPNTATWQMPVHDELVNTLMSMQTLVKVYRGADLMMHLLVVGANRVATAESRTVSFTAADPLWLLQKRLAGKSATGTIYTTLTDRGQMAKEFIDAANVDEQTGIRTGSLPHLSGSTSTYASGPYKPVSEVLADLGLTAAGFDWEIVPIEYNAGKIGDWHAAPILGITREDVKFEYGPGSGANIKAAVDTIDGNTMANKVYHIAEAGPDTPGAPVVSATNAASVATYGLREDLAQAALTDQNLRQKLVDEHVAVRKHPRRIVTFEPRDYDPTDPRNVPVYGVDYLAGDLVQAYAADETGEWFDGYFRVYGWTAKPTAEGMETGDLLLVDEGG